MIDKILGFISSFFIDINKERGIIIVDKKNTKKQKKYPNGYYYYKNKTFHK